MKKQYMKPAMEMETIAMDENILAISTLDVMGDYDDTEYSILSREESSELDWE